MSNLSTSLLEPYERYALIDEIRWEFELEVYLTLPELADQNERFRQDGAPYHFYRWSEACDA